MPDTPHIKRFDEHWKHWHEPGRMQGLLFDAGLNAIQAAHDDLAEHVERLERRFETHVHYQQENSAVAERNGYEQLESTGTPTTGPVTDPTN